MRKLVSWLSLLLVGIAFLANADIAHAQNYRSWVSRFGLDTSACTDVAPCRTFGGALAKTNAGGTINCLDAGEFGGGGSGFTITKSITIDCTGTFAGVLAVGGFPAIFILASATDIVRLRGLSLEGASGLGGMGSLSKMSARCTQSSARFSALPTTALILGLRLVTAASFMYRTA